MARYVRSARFFASPLLHSSVSSARVDFFRKATDSPLLYVGEALLRIHIHTDAPVSYLSRVYVYEDVAYIPQVAVRIRTCLQRCFSALLRARARAWAFARARCKVETIASWNVLRWILPRCEGGEFRVCGDEWSSRWLIVGFWSVAYPRGFETIGNLLLWRCEILSLSIGRGSKILHSASKLLAIILLFP